MGTLGQRSLPLTTGHYSTHLQQVDGKLPVTNNGKFTENYAKMDPGQTNLDLVKRESLACADIPRCDTGVCVGSKLEAGGDGGGEYQDGGLPRGALHETAQVDDSSSGHRQSHNWISKLECKDEWDDCSAHHSLLHHHLSHLRPGGAGTGGGDAPRQPRHQGGHGGGGEQQLGQQEGRHHG